MAAEWARLANTTIKNYIRTVEDNTLRNRALTALLKKRGRITYNWSGTEMQWPIKYRTFKPNTYAGGDTLTFARKNRWKTASIGWRGYSITDAMEKSEFLQNRGKEAIIGVFSKMGEGLMNDMEEAFGEELYVNGYAAGNEQRIHGIESFMSATLAAGAGVGNPSSTNYAGLSCVLGAYGGAWNGTWPAGHGDAHYDFWTPLVVDYGNTMFSATPKWKNNCVEAIAFAVIKARRNRSTKGKLDLFLFDDDMYRVYLKDQRTIQQINVNRGQASALVSLGFGDVINQDGIDITSEFGIPAGVGYGFNVDHMEIRSQQGQMFVPEGPSQDIATKSWRLSVDFFGNAVYNPRQMCKLVNLTSPGAALE